MKHSLQNESTLLEILSAGAVIEFEDDYVLRGEQGTIKLQTVEHYGVVIDISSTAVQGTAYTTIAAATSSGADLERILGTLAAKRGEDYVQQHYNGQFEVYTANRRFRIYECATGFFIERQSDGSQRCMGDMVGAFMDDTMNDIIVGTVEFYEEAKTRYETEDENELEEAYF